MKKDNNTRYWHFQHIGWRKLTTFLLIAGIITIIFPWTVYILGLIVPLGEAGWGFLLLTPLWYAGVIIAIVNIITAIAYLSTKRPVQNALLACGLTIALSVAHLVAIVR